MDKRFITRATVVAGFISFLLGTFLWVFMGSAYRPEYFCFGGAIAIFGLFIVSVSLYITMRLDEIVDRYYETKEKK